MSHLPSKYPRPPIIEAVCEVHLAGNSLSEEHHNELSRKWQENYPDQRSIKENSVNVHVDPSGVHVHETAQGMRRICKSADGSNLVQLSTNFFVVNRVAPYPGWKEHFLPTITGRLHEVSTVSGSAWINRVGLRYINKIEIPEEPLTWGRWFALPLPIPETPPSEHQTFQIQIRRRIDVERELIVNFGQLPSAGGTTTILLDLDIIWQGAPRPLEQVPDVLASVHDPHRVVFESYLTENTRQLFH